MLGANSVTGPVFKLKDGSLWRIGTGALAKLERAFPNIEMTTTLERAANWCEINPKKRKTAKGMIRFLDGWLGRSKTLPVDLGQIDWDAAAAIG